MTTRTRSLMTIEEFDALPREEGVWYELNELSGFSIPKPTKLISTVEANAPKSEKPVSRLTIPNCFLGFRSSSPISSRRASRGFHESIKRSAVHQR